MVMVTPGTGAPCASTTRPRSSAVLSWAAAAPVIAMSTTRNETVMRIRIVRGLLSVTDETTFALRMMLRHVDGQTTEECAPTRGKRRPYAIGVRAVSWRSHGPFRTLEEARRRR